MKILGIGNAIVDVICKVDDSFINQNNLTKSTMKLSFDENRMHFWTEENSGLMETKIATQNRRRSLIEVYQEGNIPQN